MTTTHALAHALIALTAKRAELQSRLAHRDPIAIERHADALDQIAELQAREAAAGVIDHDARLLKEVEAAIERHRAGLFGVCERCEERIGARRLEILPHARYCRECQEVVGC